jgi:PAS domain S-box-containing protein
VITFSVLCAFGKEVNLLTTSTVQSPAEIAVDLNKNKLTRVLHVDDDPALLEVTKECLKMKGTFEVHGATSAEEALEKIEREPYDVIVSDYRMPGKDGLEFLKELRQKGDTTPFIMFTGKGREEVAIKALNLGADRYLNKTGDPETVYTELAHGICQAVKARRAETRLRSALDNMLEGCQIIDRNWRYAYVNDAVARQGRSTKEKLLGNTMMEMYPGIERTEMFANFRRCMEERTPHHMTTKFEFPNGEKGWFELGIQPVPEGIFILSIDVTEREEARSQTRDSEKRYSELFETSIDGIVAADMNLHILDCNEAYQKIVGYSKDELKKLTIQQLTPERWHKMEADIMREPLRKRGYSAEYEKELRRKDGSVFPVSVREWLIVGEDGKPKGTWRIVRDITGRKKMEKELWRFSNAVKSSLDGVLISDMDGRIVEMNDAILRMYGSFDKSDLVGKNGSDLIVVEEREKAFENRKETLKEGRTKGQQYTVVTKNGSMLPVEVSATVIKDEEGSPGGFVTIVRDVTDRKKAEERILKASEEWRKTFDAISDFVFTLDKDQRLVRVNKAFCDFLKKEPEDLRGRHCYEVMHGTHEPLPNCPCKEMSLARKAVTAEIDCPNLGLSLLVTVSPLFDDKGEQTGCVHVAKDITEHKRWERELFDKQMRLQNIFAASPDAIGFADLDGNLIEYNQRAMEMLGYLSKDQVRGKTVFDFFAFKDQQRAMDFTKSILEKGLVRDIEFSLVTKDGSELPVELSASVIRDAAGNPSGVVAIARDIKDRKMKEESLRENEEKFRTLAEQSPNMIFINKKGRVVYANKKAEEAMGYVKEEFYSLDFDFLTLIAPESRELIKSDFTKHMGGEEAAPFEYKLVTKQGRVIDVILNSKLIDYEGERAILGTITDITEQKKAEKAVQESQKKFESLFIGNPEATVYLGSNLRILDVNPRFEELFGYCLAEVKGKHIDDVVVQTGMMEEAKVLNEKALEGYVYHNTVRRRKDGSLVPVAVSAAPIKVGSRLAGCVAMYTDISELKNAEKKLEEMNEKLRVVGGLTRHDVRNKLASVTGNIYLTRKKLAPNDKAQGYLSEIESAVQQVVRIFDFASAYERLGVEKLVYMDVYRTVGEAVSLFSDLHGVKVTNDCKGLFVMADSFLRQLFYNLIDNSLKYGEHTSQIRVYYERATSISLDLFMKIMALAYHQKRSRRFLLKATTQARAQATDSF